jgi:hypothetical protein
LQLHPLAPFFIAPELLPIFHLFSMCTI